MSEPKSFAVDPAGRVVSATPAQVDATSRMGGYTPVSGEVAKQLARAEADKKYVDQNWGTAGEVAMGVADGATLGLGPALATKVGLLDRGHLEAAQQSGAYTAGEVGGFLAPALLSGGTAAGEGVVARALAATPAGMLGRAGGLAEAAMGRLLPEAGILGKLGGSAVKMAARGGTEGALMNVAHEASNDIITNKPLSAQALLATGAEGFLFGGLLGAGLGGAGAAIGSATEGLADLGMRGAVRGGERSAGIALKRVGIDAAEHAATAEGTVGAVKAIKDLMAKGETSFAAPTSSIREAMTTVARDEALVAKAALKELGETAKPPTSMVSSITSQLNDEWKVMYAGTRDSVVTRRLYGEVARGLKGATEWEQMAANRASLARDAAAAGEGTLQKAVYESSLQKFDAEFLNAGTKVNEEVFKKYAAAVTQQNLAETLVESTGKKLGAEANKGNPLHLNQTDGGAMGIATLLGNPLSGAGIVAARKITGYVQDKLEPIIAEYAARSAIGARAGAATAHVGERISGALRSFMRGGTRAGQNYRATSKAGEPTSAKLSYTMKAGQEAMDKADELTSQAHQQRVREYMEELSRAGHPDLANEMGLAYGRAVSYINANRPKGTLKDREGGSLGKLPKQLGYDDKTMKFLRHLHSMRDPVGTVVDGLAKGNLSRDAVAAIKYVMPDLHADLVSRAAQEAMALRQDGKFLPADKLALLGVALDHPVDSKLSKDFINEIQQGLAANAKPPPQGSGPPPVTDVSSYQTPLQSAV